MISEAFSDKKSELARSKPDIHDTFKALLWTVLRKLSICFNKLTLKYLNQLSNSGPEKISYLAIT